jgi:hypothetical protein
MSDQIGFTLYIDEAGDEGVSRVRPIDTDGASEYFVLAGVLVQSARVLDLNDHVAKMQSAANLAKGSEIHFRDLAADEQLAVVRSASEFKAGLLCVTSNKRNMRRYRNKRVEASVLETKRNGKIAPQKYNWFYNHTVRYLLEAASKECARWSPRIRSRRPKIDIVFSLRKEFSYSQMSAYLEYLRTKGGSGPFNNLHNIDWSVVSPYLVRAEKAKDVPGLQFADCVASAVYRAVDADWFGDTVPEYLELLGPRFLKATGAETARGHGFKLLPRDFSAPLTTGQTRAFRAVGYSFEQPTAPTQ